MTDHTDQRKPWLPLGVALFISGVVVAAAFNPAPHNGGDNAAYVTLAFSLAEHGSYTDLYDPAALPHTKYPPVFPALLALLMMLGARTWTALKTVAALSTIATVGFTYLWAQRRVGRLGALGVSVALALSSAMIYYSHWVLSDPLFLTFTMAALWALEGADEEGASPWWLAAGVAAAGLAYFTRSAGLPLLVALVAWLVLRKRWRHLSIATVAIGVPALAWFLRGRGEGVAEYGAEFWMVDPYQPALGTVGLGGLVGRALNNAWTYLSAHGPGGVIGGGGGYVMAFGFVLTGVALTGWFRSARMRIGPAELFLPLYVGLILLWPEVWSGDRFALPLYPLFFGFGALALREASTRLGGSRGSALIGIACLAVVLPAGRGWLDSIQQASGCARISRDNGAWACYGPGVVDFAEAAAWMGRVLPEGSAVMTRKPRLFYVMSSLPSRTFPFDEDPAVQLAEADRVGARYIVLDQWDGLAGRYLGGALRRYPQAFCTVQAFGEERTTYVLGVKPLESRGASNNIPVEEVRVDACPADYAPGGTLEATSSSSARIPLLDGLDS